MRSSSRTQNIPITHGEHERSPHLTHSTSRDIHAVASSHVTTHREPTPTQPRAAARLDRPLEVQLLQMQITPRVQQRVRAHIQQRMNEQMHVTRVAARRSFAWTAALKKIPHARTLMPFILVALIIVSPLHAITTFERLRDARAQLETLPDTATAQSFSSVQATITDTLRTFHAANTTLSHVGGVEEFILRHAPVIGEQFGAAQRLTAAGERVSFAAASYIQLFKTLEQQKNQSLVERLGLFFEGNRAVVSDLKIAADLVRPINPESFDDKVQRTRVYDARAAILALHNDASYLASAGPLILSTLGSTTPRRYLVVFQNSAELRPTGGFIGSFALLDIENGEVKRLDVPAGGSYDLQGMLKMHVRAPLPLHIINARWEFQDGNWFPDFPTSARKLMWFLEKSRGPSVDGVIAINSSVLTDLLRAVGPVMLENGKTLTADTALKDMRQSIDTAAARQSTTPKKLITETAPALVRTISAGSRETFLPLMTTLLQSLERRDIQMYARDAKLQSQIAEFGWDGAVQQVPNSDYLYIVSTNIGGQKTDAVTDQTIDHQARVADDGSVTVTVRVRRSQRTSDQPLEGGPNVTYVRYYVPRGSTLVSATGFTTPPEQSFRAAPIWQTEDEDLRAIEKEVGTDPASGTRITEEFGHTVFGNWMITHSGGASETIITYRIPLTLSAKQRVTHYRAFFQHQSGLANTTLSSRVIIPASWRPAWVSDTHAKTAANGTIIETPFTHDYHYGTTFYTKTP